MSKRKKKNNKEVKKANMKMILIKKTQFAGLNNKIFYFLNGISSLLFGHHLFENVRQEKMI